MSLCVCVFVCVRERERDEGEREREREGWEIIKLPSGTRLALLKMLQTRIETQD